MNKLVGAVREFDRFSRVHFVGFSCLWPLLGLLSGEGSAPCLVWFCAIGIGVCYHFFGGVLNNVIDLPIDRSQPKRALDPLVKGTISVQAALLFAVVQIPAAFGLAWWAGASTAALVCLGTAFFCMAVYDVIGKSSPIPPLTDLVQGLGWGALVLFGAYLTDAPPGAISILIASYAAGYILLINGVHGGMRDLANDSMQGARTTALYLGIQQQANGHLLVTRTARVFCWLIHTLLIVLALATPFVASTDTSERILVLVAIVAAAVVNMRLMLVVLQPEHARWQEAFRLHLVTLLLLPILVLLPLIPLQILIGLLALLLIPMAVMEYAQPIAGWLLHRR